MAKILGSATPPRLVVVGGGITGLAAAYHLTELSAELGRPIELCLLEARGRLGGTIGTERTGGFLIEAGPDSFLSEKPWALALCGRLGITDRLVRTNDAYRRTFVVHRGRLLPLPDGFMLLAPTRIWPIVSTPLFSWPGKLRLAMDLVLPRGRTGGDESLSSFVRRRLGREALERVAQPLVGGIYTADPDTLSLAATIPRFLEMERKHRSLIWALWRQRRRQVSAAPAASGARWSLFVTFANGMQEFVETLAGRLPEGAIRLRTPVAGLARGEGGHRWRVRLADGSGLDADAILLTAEAHQAARVVSDLDTDLAAMLEAIPYAGSATVTLAYRREAIPHPLDGFGFVVPRTEGRPILACTFSSVKYPGRASEGHVLLRLFFGGALQEDVLKMDDDGLEAAARKQLAELLGVSGPPLLTRVYRYGAVMPQYLVGHLDRVAAIESRLARHPGLAVAGSAFRGVGIADCIRTAEESAEKLLESTKKGEEGTVIRE